VPPIKNIEKTNENSKIEVKILAQLLASSQDLKELLFSSAG